MPDSPAVELNDEERDGIFAALFELRVRQSAFDGDPDADQISVAVSHATRSTRWS